MINAKVQEAREVAIPKGALKISSKKSPTVAYLFDNTLGQPAAKIFVGNAFKPAVFYRFPTTEKRMAYVTQYMQTQDEVYAFRQGQKAEKAAKLAEPQTVLAVGDVLMASWGYDQTNIDYYEVVELKGKRGVIIREIGTEDNYNNRTMTGRSTPKKGDYQSEPMLKKVDQYGNVKVRSFAYASKLDPVKVGDVVVGYPSTAYSSYA